MDRSGTSDSKQLDLPEERRWHERPGLGDPRFPSFWRGPDDPRATLWYRNVPLPKLLTDVARILPMLTPGMVLRVYTDITEASVALPEVCASQGATCRVITSLPERAGDQHPYSKQCYDIQVGAHPAARS